MNGQLPVVSALYFASGILTNFRAAFTVLFILFRLAQLGEIARHRINDLLIFLGTLFVRQFGVESQLLYSVLFVSLDKDNFADYISNWSNYKKNYTTRRLTLSSVQSLYMI